MSQNRNRNEQTHSIKIPSRPTLLNQKEVSKIIRKSEAWLERKRWEGSGIPYRKMGHHVFYEEIDVIDWVEQYQKITNTSQKEGRIRTSR